MTATEAMIETEKEILTLKADNFFLEMEMRKLLTSLKFVRDIELKNDFER